MLPHDLTICRKVVVLHNCSNHFNGALSAIPKRHALCSSVSVHKRLAYKVAHK